ncbi:MAG: hypothetical protein ACKVP0_24810 [Pirellulaceae bacterium]
MSAKLDAPTKPWNTFTVADWQVQRQAILRYSSTGSQAFKADQRKLAGES